MRNGGQSEILQLKPGSILTLQCSQSFSFASAHPPSPPPTHPPSIHSANLLHPTCRPTPQFSIQNKCLYIPVPLILPPNNLCFSRFHKLRRQKRRKKKENRFELSYLFPDAIIPSFTKCQGAVVFPSAIIKLTVIIIRVTPHR